MMPGPMEIAVVLVVALVIFGPKRLPELGKSLGSGMRSFKDSVTGDDEADEPVLPAEELICRAVAITVDGIEELQALLGQTVGPTEWRTVTQEMIDTFAELSGDDQWIHVDVERAKTESPFGTTIAHGNLTLSLIDGFRKDLVQSTGFRLGVNYGWNKVRFPAPVPAGARVRASSEVVSVDEVGEGWWQVATKFTLEVEGSEKPCCVAESVGRALV